MRKSLFFLLITHIGTIISIKQLAEQWRTIVVCLAGLVGMIGLGYAVGQIFMSLKRESK